HTLPMPEGSKPRLRGVIHQWSLVAAVPAGVVLVAVADGARARLATLVYAVAMAAMLGASALYHRVSWKTARRRAWARRLDHAMIFVFIAGTYTPFALLSFEGWLPVLVLACVWSGAALGLVVNLAWIDAPKWVTAPAYLLVGWVGVVAAPQLFSAVGVAGAVLLIVGGALYTLGALTYATHWPNPFPRTFGFHEVFHLLVTTAVVVQLVAVYLVAV
ncbi:MAG TPA: hemolysin III family protein, partial [Gaiellaceae bacterium]|nr:hemolysin III family protein [Gaiellaceae bacterium]